MGDFFKISSTRLGLKLLFWILIFSSLITLVFTIGHLYFDYKIDRELLEQHFQRVEHVNIPRLTAYLAAGNQEALVSQLEEIHGSLGFVFTKLLDQNGQLLYQTESRKVEYLVRKEWPLFINSQGSNQIIGKLIIDTCLDDIYARLIDKALMILVSQAVKTFIVSFFILFLVYHLVTQRLCDVFVFLQQWSPSVAGSDRPLPLGKSLDKSLLAHGSDTEKNKYSDELDELLVALEAMRVRLEGSFEKLQQLSAGMQNQESQFQQMLESISDAVLLIDIKTQSITQCNPCALQQLGYQKDELIGKAARDIFGDSAEALLSLQQSLENNNQNIEPKELQMLAADGHVITVETVVSLLEFQDCSHLLSLSRDISKRKHQEEKINYMAWYDDLTGLPNRALIRDRISQSLSYNQRYASFSSLIFVDLDHFKEVNDSFGHQTGDELLKTVGRRLESELRAEDSVGRLGGDEFVVLLSKVGETAAVAQCAVQCVAEKLRSLLAEPVVISGYPFRITSSMGGAVYSGEPASIDDVLRQADFAMYQSKKRGRNCFSLFSKETTAKDSPTGKRLIFINSLRDAQRNEEFSLFYQPIVDMKSMKVTSIEALIRWNKNGEFISPDMFIAPLCEAGLMTQVGTWVIEHACLAMMEQLTLHTQQKAVPIAVNVNTTQFDNKAFVEQLQATLDMTALPPELLVLEVTEELALCSMEDAMERLHEVRDLGVQLALDDFGTGVSSLSCLKRLPANQLKIDRSFICDIEDDEEDKAIVSAIIDMAKTLKLDVVAEGVESVEQANILLKMGCHQAQGYYYMPPQASLDKAMQVSRASNNVKIPDAVMA